MDRIGQMDKYAGDLGVAPRICFAEDCPKKSICYLSLSAKEGAEFLPSVTLERLGPDVRLRCLELTEDK